MPAHAPQTPCTYITHQFVECSTRHRDLSTSVAEIDQSQVLLRDFLDFLLFSSETSLSAPRLFRAFFSALRAFFAARSSASESAAGTACSSTSKSMASLLRLEDLDFFSLRSLASTGADVTPGALTASSAPAMADGSSMLMSARTESMASLCDIVSNSNNAR